MNMYTDSTQVSNAVKTIPTKLNDIISTIMSKVSQLLDTPTSQEIQKIDWSSIATVLGTISIFLILAIIFCIMLYILKSVGIYTMAKKEGKDFAWLAFVPFGCLFIYGLILGKTKIFGVEVEHAEFVLPILFASSYLPFVGPISTILFILAYFAILYKIYQSRTPNFAVVLLLLSIIVPIASPIILFAIRKNNVEH